MKCHESSGAGHAERLQLAAHAALGKAKGKGEGKPKGKGKGKSKGKLVRSHTLEQRRDKQILKR